MKRTYCMSFFLPTGKLMPTVGAISKEREQDVEAYFCCSESLKLNIKLTNKNNPEASRQ